jgi:serine/threonine-protein kinase
MHGPIGAGGMATVHLGRLVGDAGFARLVAIKRLRPHLAHEPEIVAAFADEARLAARVRHPNVVTMLDIVSKEGEVFLVMDYVEGVSLASLVQACANQGEHVPPPIAAAIVAQAVHGLHAAHEARSESGGMLNLVHRDVSPQNVLVGVDGVARVVDFGVAKAIGRQQTTRDGSIKGKLGYMAPEQLSGRAVTRKADIFAAGVVLWELLTEQRLFRTGDDAVTLTRTLFEPIAAPSKACAKSPKELDAVVMRALERDPARRFASGDEMATALERAMTLAATRTVGEWVRQIAAEELLERARQVEVIERGGDPASEDMAPASKRAASEAARPEETPVPTATPARSGAGRSRGAIVALVATPLAVVAVLTGWFVQSRERDGRVLPAGVPAETGSATASASVVEERGAPVPAPPQASVSPAPAESASSIDSQGESAGVPIARPRRPSPRLVPPRTAPAAVIPSGSARERLYSRD